eukprot:Colp12_sorted_trinity150504_noHs@6196
MSSTLDLLCWSSEWGLPSADVHSLAILAYGRFVDKHHAIVAPIYCNNPLLYGNLPVLREKDGKVTKDLHDIIDNLKEKGYDLDEWLEPQQKVICEGLCRQIQETLGAFLEICLFLDEAHYYKTTRSFYASVLPFPLNLVWPGRMRNTVAERYPEKVFTLGCFKDEGQVPKLHNITEDAFLKYYQLARRTLLNVARLVEGNKFAMGDRPSTVDALLFAHLAVILHTPWGASKHTPKEAVTSTNTDRALNAYYNRVKLEYFPDIQSDGESLEFAPYEQYLREGRRKQQKVINDYFEREKKAPGKFEEDYHLRRRQTLFIGLGVMSMLSFAVWNYVVVPLVAAEMEKREQQEDKEGEDYY